MRSFLILVITLFASIHTAASQSELEMDRFSLSEIPPMFISVYVESSGGLAGAEALDVGRFHTAVDSLLTVENIPIRRDEPSLVIDRAPYLSVHVNALEMSNGLIPFSIEVEVIQRVLLSARDSQPIHAATWDASLVGLVSPDKLDSILYAAIDLADDFVEDYHIANPQPRP